MHNEELHNLYTLPNIIRLIKKWAWHIACMEKKTNACRVLVGKGNIKMDLKDIQWGGMNWIQLTQDREQWKVLMYMVMSLQVP
jgi:hypothetical protein